MWARSHDIGKWILLPGHLWFASCWAIEAFSFAKVLRDERIEDSNELSGERLVLIYKILRVWYEQIP